MQARLGCGNAETQSQGAHNADQSRQSRISSIAERPIERLTRKPAFFRYSGHALRPRQKSKRIRNFASIPIRKHSVEIVSGVYWRLDVFSCIGSVHLSGVNWG